MWKTKVSYQVGWLKRHHKVGANTFVRSHKIKCKIVQSQKIKCKIVKSQKIKCKISFFLSSNIKYYVDGLCKKEVTPVLTHWSYVFLAITHQCITYSNQCAWYLRPIKAKETINCPWLLPAPLWLYCKHGCAYNIMLTWVDTIMANGAETSTATTLLHWPCHEREALCRRQHF